MSAIGKPNLRRCAGGGMGLLRRPKSRFVKGFKLAAKTVYGRTVSNIQGKGIPNDGSSYIIIITRTAQRTETSSNMFISASETQSKSNIFVTLGSQSGVGSGL